MKKTIEELGAILDDATILGNKRAEAHAIKTDSRKVREGDLFFAIKGLHVDGHSFIPKVVEQGASIIVVSEDVDVPDHIGILKVKDTHEAMLALAPHFYDYPAQKMRMIGVTGTNGKTTTTHIIGHVLEEMGYKVGIIGTVHVLINGVSYPIHNTTPDAGDLQPMLYKMIEEGVQYCIMEVSSHALEMRRIAGVEYDTGVFTNLTQDHLDYHKTFENYFNAKALLFEQLSKREQEKENKGAVINIDDPYGKQMLERTSCPVLTYSITEKSDLQALDIKMTSKSITFTLAYKGKTYPVHINSTGAFNIYNTLASIGALVDEHLSIEDIIAALETFHAVPGRFELIEEGQDFAVVVDYAHSPDGLENILETAKEVATGKIIAVYGCGGDRDATKRPIMGAIGAQHADYVIVTSDNPRTEEPNSIVEQVAQGIIDSEYDTPFEEIVDRYKAIERAIKMAKKGDIILIAGKGHEDYQILKDKTIHFDDREVAREVLKEIV